ncbi:diguanylate cyclase [Roseomonas sp. BN140053]|uniref:diguanylate cyclase n=1 Tax=Roseomonas sp. BN140053 TaxID=3391898 RepID=UPI0039EBDC0C
MFKSSPNPEARLARYLVLGVVLAVLLGSGAAVQGNWEGLRIQAAEEQAADEAADARQLLTALLESEAALRGYILYGNPQELGRFDRAATLLENGDARRIAAAVDASPVDANTPPILGPVIRVVAARREVLARLQAGEREQVIAEARTGVPQQQAGGVRMVLERYIAHRSTLAEALAREMGQVQTRILWLVLLSTAVSLGALVLAALQLRRRSLSEVAARSELNARNEEVGSLLRMSEMLQACQDEADLRRVVLHTAPEVLPGVPGALFVFNNSRDRLDCTAVWPDGMVLAGPDHFSPGECWALKRGRPHLYGPALGVPCEHVHNGLPGLEVPMTARGELYGVMQFGCAVAGRPGPIPNRDLAVAFADGVSMALANLSLREKLRGQALRDPLTGLYNRRFLEEVSERYAGQADRRGEALSVVMLDVDHFKQVNDRHGHAAGDAVLRALGALITGTLRRGDVACRYGGEEILLLLPDCDPAAARDRMEDLRNRVAAMHEGADSALPRVTISAGVAAIPTHGGNVTETIRLADAALYAAKQGGRNRVVLAPTAAEKAGPGLQLLDAG